MHLSYHIPLLQALTEDDPLHIILDELGPPGKQLSYSMNATICLSLTNRWDHSKGMLCHCICVLVWLCVLVYLCIGLAMYWSDVLVIIGQALVVRKVDNAIHRINHYPMDRVVCFVNTYPLDSNLSGG